MPTLAQMQPGAMPVPDAIQLPPNGFPEIPQEILDRFPSAQDWGDQLKLWYNQLASALDDWTNPASSTVTTIYQGQQNLSKQQGILSAEITTLSETVISGNAALASQIITISALASRSSHISAQTTAPVGPVLNDIWVDTANIAAPITYFWNGVAWQLQATPIIATAVSTEASARASADGNLSGKFTLTVVAGNVVTGMNITSSTGGGTNISNVIFQAGSFQIYNGATGVPAFNLTGGNLTLTGSITLSNSQVSGLGTLSTLNTANYNTQLTNQPTASTGAILVAPAPSGAGLYLGSTNLGYYSGSAWTTYMDSSGNFYLGGTSGSLQWNGTTLTIVGNGTFSGALSAATGTFSGTLSAATGSFSGTITASSGTIGGWTIGASALTGGTVTLSSAGSITVGSGVNKFTSSSGGVVFGTAGAVSITVNATGGQIFLNAVDATGTTVAGIGSVSNGVGGLFTTALFWSGNASASGNLTINSTTYCYFNRGTNPPNTNFASYTLNVSRTDNAVGDYGLFVGTNWAAAENKVISVGNINSASGAVTDYFNVRGDGILEYGSFVSSAGIAVTGYIVIRDIGGATRRLLVG